VKAKTWFFRGMSRRLLLVSALPLVGLSFLGACASDRSVVVGEEIAATSPGTTTGGAGKSTNPNGRPGGAVGGFRDGTVPPGDGEAADDAILYGNAVGTGVSVATGADGGLREAGALADSGHDASGGGARDGGGDGAADAALIDAAVPFDPGAGNATNSGLPPCAIVAAHEQVCNQAPGCANAAYRQCRRAEVRGALDANFVLALQTCVKNTCSDFDACFAQAMSAAPRTPTYGRMLSTYCNTCFAKNALCGINPDQALPGLQQYADRTLVRAEACAGSCGDDARFGDCLALNLAPRIPLPGVCANSY
jgi:hypothetical protein